jgi:hypothetical protein
MQVQVQVQGAVNGMMEHLLFQERHPMLHQTI